MYTKKEVNHGTCKQIKVKVNERICVFFQVFSLPSQIFLNWVCKIAHDEEKPSEHHKVKIGEKTPTTL